MFKAGDTVSYGTSGVCTIAEQKRVTLGGQPHDCFILKPVYDASMKICVPCDSAPLLERMRPLPTRDDLQPLQMALRTILFQSSQEITSSSSVSNATVYARSVEYAAIVVSTLPILLVYPFVQKYFVTGMTMGAVKA